ncbi:hypothetical protein [Corynebacterium terpenotabidum]|uniref:Uncharacterized protein n=1 Tax=Corynebacterium terpenotabidum Y-11 TaxID=1200352 RepID=S4XFP7_9CORY|nr:hypothetical protein [Corynebacterium terpenotabidum]AGP30450.1 hypothetical protein A606_04005 [Corynebacterium terpenotabidum Y-11]
MSHREHRTVRPSAAAVVLGAALLLTGCDSDGAGVEDAGSQGDDHVDTALSSSVQQGAPQPTTAAGTAAGIAATAASPVPTAPAVPAVADGATVTTTTGASAVAAGTYQVPLGDTTLLCDFAADPAATGYAWACEAPGHLGWDATDGGEANAVAYRPGGSPEVYAVLGNSGLTAGGSLSAGTVTTVGDRYQVDTTDADAVVITDTTTGTAVLLSTDGYTQL